MFVAGSTEEVEDDVSGSEWFDGGASEPPVSKRASQLVLAIFNSHVMWRGRLLRRAAASSFLQAAQ